MKRLFKSLTLVTLMLAMTAPAWGQASTEGREFWVALNITTGTAGGDHKPFICITTQHPGGSYSITNPADPSFTPINGQIPATGYIKIEASTTPTAGQIDLNKWYPVGQTAPSMSCQTKNVGLKVTTTVDCSVFAGNMLPQSFDAANILPITALQTDYITQDYPGYDHGGTGQSDGGFPEITILATEDNTTVTVIPSTNVLNNNGKNPISKTLNTGQVLYITGENRTSLSGSVVTSDKKIAVFTGVNNTDVPGPKSARDHLYEQNMPTVYWGTHFVVTRSMRKDANRIRVTASNNGTEVIVDGNSLATINAGDTYEFELCEAAMRQQTPYTSAVDEGRGTEFYLDGEAHYLETTCPCAVFSYDVSENYYISNGTSERDPNAHGDPSMVWISPIEQQLRNVTFSVMNTNKTTTHFVNIVTLTSGAASLEVKEVTTSAAGIVVYGNNLVQPTDVKPVPGNPTYSYARIKLAENENKVYTITSGIGFIAHVYGSGDKESYAYSCGSAAVKQGVIVGDERFTDGYRSDSKFCSGVELTFDSRVGTDEITRVDWDFGDGTTDFKGAPVTTHTYNTPGWYDVTAQLWGHQACAEEDEQDLGSVTFTFRIWRHDTVIVAPTKKCLTPQQQDSIIQIIGQDKGQAYLDSLVANPQKTILNPNAECNVDRQLSVVTYGLETTREEYAEGWDSVWVHGKWYYPDKDPKLPADGIIQWTDTNANEYNCDIHVTCHAKIITCLDIEIFNNPDEQYICLGETSMLVNYIKRKGNVDGDTAVFTIAGMPSFRKKINIPPANIIKPGTLNLPLDGLTRPGYYIGYIAINDTNCANDKTHPEIPEFNYPVNITVRYPSDIFKCKFNNVLAVYNSGSGGNEGYVFKGYQWYRNGIAIPGANESIYYLGEGNRFNENDTVFVELTDQSGMTLKSCPQVLTAEDVRDYSKPNQAPARKVIRNQQMYIIRDEQIYDIYGQRVQ